MTAISRNGNQKSQFGAWMRTIPQLDSRQAGISLVDIDWCLHRFIIHDPTSGQKTKLVQNMMMIEEKTFSADCSYSQSDTLKILSQILKPSRDHLPVRCDAFNKDGQKVKVLWWGYHLLQFSQGGPLDSDFILWDRKAVSTEDLIAILRFDISPFTLRPRTWRDHHGGTKQLRIF